MSNSKIFLLPFIFWQSSLEISKTNAKRSPFLITKAAKGEIGKKTLEAMKNLHMNWYAYALKALIGQMGKEIYRSLDYSKLKLKTQAFFYRPPKKLKLLNKQIVQS